MNEQKGITLIVLVITIIVLSILAGVSINFVLGENGLFTEEGKAIQTHDRSSIIEKIRLEIMAKKTDNNGKIAQYEVEEILEHYGTINKNNEEIKSVTINEKNYEISYEEIYDGITHDVIVGEIVTETNKKYQKNGMAVIPVGFAIVPGLDDVSEGLVISDIANDTENEGNQFVWIPVDKETFDTKFKRTEGYWEKALDTMMPECGEVDSSGVNSKITEDLSVVQEAIIMYESVKSNGGFYIGRYETGNEGGTYNTETKKWEGDNKAVVKKGANVYNYIGWSDSNIMTNVTGGAVQVAREMYTGKKTADNENYGVTSMLCYGVQWDAALNFIDPNYITNEVEVDGKLQPNCASNSYLVDSTGKGWCKDNYNPGNTSHITGVDVDSQASNKVNNIYDMAGNVLEWTMESYESNSRIYRGRLLFRIWRYCPSVYA